MIKLLINVPKLKRIILIDMIIGPLTTTALILLNKSKSSTKIEKSFAIDLRNCTLINFEQKMPDLLTCEHPLIG